MKIHIGIVGHHSREQQAKELAQTVDADYLRIDREDRPSIAARIAACATGHLDVLEHLRKQLPSTDGWVVVLEDDVTPVPDFRAVLAEALQHAPTGLVGLYLGSGNPSGAVQRSIGSVINTQLAWLVGDYFISSPGYAVHRSSLLDLLVDCLNEDRSVELPLRINRWAQFAAGGVGLKTSYTCPSLVDHRDDDSVVYPGVPQTERRKLPRKAHRFGPASTYDTAWAQLPTVGPPWGRA